MSSNSNTGVMTSAQFIAKWCKSQLSERAASQEHFIDLCRLLGQPTPAEHDSTGAEYSFEKGVAVTAAASKGTKGESGFADVWWRNKFAWEYKRKGKYKTLEDAYRQLCQYREALENPPLLVVCDIERLEIHTNFTGTVKQVHEIRLVDFDQPEKLSLLRRIFTDPNSFKPQITPERVTKEVADQFGKLAQSIAKRGSDPHDVAHFLMKCMFCLFAEDVGLLPKDLFKQTLNQWHTDPARLQKVMTTLFDTMRTGGAFGSQPIEWFNGGLFDNQPALLLTEGEISVLILASNADWNGVEPAIFGTLFERSLDPTKRAQIGAHYTSRDDILLIIEPVIMAPLRRQWESIKQECEKLLAQRAGIVSREQKGQRQKGEITPQTLSKRVEKLIRDFVEHLSHLRILDPACGSGNFLYVAIQQLLMLEKEVVTYAARPEIGMGLIPNVRPTLLHGIEINPYAAELAQVVIWIGYLQWMRDNGFNVRRDPILDKLQTIENRDAILDFSAPYIPQPPAPPGDSSRRTRKTAAAKHPPNPPAEPGAAGRTVRAATWPDADFIIGNPPFLGSKVFRQNGLTDDYVAAMYAAFDLPKTSDLCCYWFELGRRAIEQNPATRLGLLATQGIRGGDNRTVLQRIKKTGDIFLAWSDRDWILEGAAVHVSIVGFAASKCLSPILDGKLVDQINADLTTEADTTQAKKLSENTVIGWSIGTQKGGSFEFDHKQARQILVSPNPNGKSNFDVIRPWRNASDITGRLRGLWIVDFGPYMEESIAAGYESAFEYVRRHVKPDRDHNRRDSYRLKWWIHQEPRGELRPVLESPYVLLTPRISKHRIWICSDSSILPDCAMVVFAAASDYFFGVMHSAVQELWALQMGTQLEDRPRYTPTTCFETFPLPWSPGKEPTKNPVWKRISEAAKELNEQRERWLNPPEWIEPMAKIIDATDNFADVPAEARPLIRQSAIMAAVADNPQFKKRTLTNLYNERPTWLKLAHLKLDQAVLAAYAATDPKGGWCEEWAKVWEGSGAGQELPRDHALAAQRKEIDQHVLSNLLRLNQQRS